MKFVLVTCFVVACTVFQCEGGLPVYQAGRAPVIDQDQAELLAALFNKAVYNIEADPSILQNKPKGRGLAVGPPAINPAGRAPVIDQDQAELLAALYNKAVFNIEADPSILQNKPKGRAPPVGPPPANPAGRAPVIDNDQAELLAALFNKAVYNIEADPSILQNKPKGRGVAVGLPPINPAGRAPVIDNDQAELLAAMFNKAVSNIEADPSILQNKPKGR